MRHNSGDLGGSGTVAVLTPRGVDRGHQVTLRVPNAPGLAAALAARGVIADHRPGSLLRLGFAPLYVSYADALHAARTVAEVLAAPGPAGR